MNNVRGDNFGGDTVHYDTVPRNFHVQLKLKLFCANSTVFDSNSSQDKPAALTSWGAVMLVTPAGQDFFFFFQPNRSAK